MSRTSYLLRRGDALTFRISVPVDLRPILGVREITKTLSTSDRCQAAPIALSLAAQAKRLFITLRTMTEKKNDKVFQTDYTLEVEMDEFGAIKKLKVDAEPHEQDAVNANIKTVIETGRVYPPKQQGTSEPQSRRARPGSTPTLKTVVDEFLRKYPKDKKTSMFKKHQAVLPMFLEVVGDKPVTDIKQADINGFFELVERLPPLWKNACRKLNISVQELAKLEHDVTMGPKSFYDTYRASVRPLLKAAKKDWQDQGFPLGLTTDDIEYLGDREEGEHKQRAFKPDELKRLFEGQEMQAFAADRAQVHCYWLLHVGLYAGARVNEICQLNPQTDVLQDVESGIWYLWMTAQTPADDGIVKSIKTGDSRRVPLHPKLIDLGFLDYVDALNRAGKKRLFPQWEPYNKRASGEAEKWFRQFLRDTDLRDETPKAMLLGMHAFRHTLLTYGARQKLNLTCITGHEQSKNPVNIEGVAVGYLDESLLCDVNLLDAKARLEQLDYGINFHRVNHS